MPGLSQIGFGGGIAEGLAAGIANKRERETRDKQAQIQNIWKSIGFLVDSGQVQDVSELQPHFDMLSNLGAFGDVKKKGKAGELNPQDHVTNILGRIIGAQKPLQAGPMATQPAPHDVGPDDAGNVQPGPLESRAIGSSAVPAAAPAKPRPSLMGIQLLSPEEASQAKTDRALNAQQQEITGKISLARRILPALQAVDPSANLDDALAAVGIRPPTAHTATPQSVAGEINGKPAFAIFTGSGYLDPVTKQPLEGFTPRTTTGSTSLGADRESVARELFGKRAADLTPEQMATVNGQVESMAASKAGAITTARGEAQMKTPKERFAALRDLQGDWRKVDAPVKETQRQYQIMETGLKRFKEGDKNGGSQAVLVTFQKILDPSSVVRESEYDRSPEGLGLKQRMQGWLERLQTGGAGVPEAELEAMVKTAKDFLDGMATYNDLERDRITQAAKEAGLDPARVFGVAAAAQKKSGTGTGKTATPSKASKDANGNWVITIP